LLKGYCRIDDRDDLRRVHDKVAGTLLALDIPLGLTRPALLSFLDVPVADATWQALDPPRRRQQRLDAVARVLVRQSQVQPLLLVVEELHWIDAETQALLDRLMHSLPAARMLVLVTYRPEYQHGWGHKTYYTQLRLDPLPSAHAKELLHALLGIDPDFRPLVQQLLARTKGNPFFLEESVRSLVDQGILVCYGAERAGVQSAPTTVPLSALHLPTTVQAVLAARIDRLPPHVKGLLQPAAVIGTEVPFPLLEAIAERPEDALAQRLRRLQSAEFLSERLFPEPEHTFTHALTHEVAYGSLLQERRRALHGRIVDALERLYPDRLAEQVDRLADHALRGEVWTKAVAYGRQAGAKAVAHSANREAAAYYEQAPGALAHLPDRRDTREQAVDLRFDRCMALLPLGDYGRVGEVLREAEAFAEALEDQHRLGLISAFMVEHCKRMGEPDRAVASGQRALALAEASGDVASHVMVTYFLGRSYWDLGDYPRGDSALGEDRRTPRRGSGA
jgi:predicted ATPase